MQEDNYLLISLKDEQSKKLAQVISNDTSRKILEFLTKKDASETAIAKEMNIPLSTVHYNMQALVKSGLVKVDEFHYSEKGKEINHYSLANKFIIIAPAGEDKWKQALKSFLPIGMFGMAATFGVFLWEKMVSRGTVLSVDTIAPTAAKQAAVADEVMAESGAFAADQAVEAVATAPPIEPVQAIVSSEPNLWLWFLLGTVFTLIVMVLWEWLRQKKR